MAEKYSEVEHESRNNFTGVFVELIIKKVEAKRITG